MIEATIRALLKRLTNLERDSVSYRKGVVTSISPLSVTLGGSTVAYTGVKSLNTVAIGDVVSVLVFGNDLVILGRAEPYTARFAFNFVNGWRPYVNSAMASTNFGGACGYYKDGSGTVHLEGLLDKGGGNWIGGEHMLHMPVGFRPAAQRMWQVPVSPNAFSRIDINPGGEMVLQGGGAAHPVGYLCVDGVSYRAA